MSKTTIALLIVIFSISLAINSRALAFGPLKPALNMCRTHPAPLSWTCKKRGEACDDHDECCKWPFWLSCVWGKCDEL